jgi:BlaI family transcriptional regulator, penicillinase repressor
MARERKPQAIQDTEWDLLEALWEAERATAPQVAAALAKKRGWAYSTVKTLLDRMLAKGLVHGRQVGNVWEYSAAVRRIEARRSAWARFVASAFGGATAPALQFLAKDAKLTKAQLAQLRAMIEEDDDG